MQVIGPDDGPLAEGESGPGRMREPDAIVAALATATAGSHDQAASLAGLRIVVSAGPTYEDIDPVRFIGNRSSGKMGFAIAAAAAARGAETCAGRRSGRAGDARRACAASTCVRPRRCTTRCSAQLPADAYIGAAAVADFTPRAGRDRQDQEARRRGRPDAASWCARPTSSPTSRAHAQRPRLVVGFAAETDDVEAYARGKLQKQEARPDRRQSRRRRRQRFRERRQRAGGVLERRRCARSGPAPKTLLAGRTAGPDRASDCTG